MEKPIKLVVGKKYLFQGIYKVYFCGYNQFDIPVVETINCNYGCEDNTDFIPEKYKPKADGKYWHWKGMESELTNIKKEKNEKSNRKQTKRKEAKEN